MNIGISFKLRHFSFRALIIHHVTVFDKYHFRSCQHTHIVDIRQLRIVINSIKMEGKENLDVRYLEWYFWELERKAERGFLWKRKGAKKSWSDSWTWSRHANQGEYCRLRFSLGFGSYCLDNEYPLKGFKNMSKITQLFKIEAQIFKSY